jgi:chemotaxis protein CheD
VRQHRVRVADYAVARAPDVLATMGLGSCVAIALWSESCARGALGHILLPDESLSRDTGNRAKFASTAVPLLLDALRRDGARGPIVAKIAGGASMFASLLSGEGGNIGERNVAAVRVALHASRIPLVGEDVGGDFGRSVYLHADTGRVVVRSLRRGETVL